MKKKMLILVILSLFLGLSPSSTAVASYQHPPVSEVDIYLECEMWGHYYCMCSQQIRDTVAECAGWGHYRCICPQPQN